MMVIPRLFLRAFANLLPTSEGRCGKGWRQAGDQIDSPFPTAETAVKGLVCRGPPSKVSLYEIGKRRKCRQLVHFS